MHDEHRQPDARTAAGHLPRWKVLGVLSAAVLLLHGALLGGFEGPWPEHAALAAAALQVRTVVASDANANVAAATGLAPASVVPSDADTDADAEAADADADADAGAGAGAGADGPVARAATHAKAVSATAESAAAPALPSKAPAAAAPQQPTGAATMNEHPALAALALAAPGAPDASSKVQESPDGDLESPTANAHDSVVGPSPAELSTTPGPRLAPASAADSAIGAQMALAAVNAPAITATAAEPAPIPRYRTEMPPAATLAYQIGRGLLRGSAELAWQPQGDRYAFRLEAFVAGITVLRQVSQGGFDAAGLAPVRFTDKRVRRAEEAANFQRDRGQITFSARSTQLALHAGTQDRLSWMIQLAAIAAADPALRREGAQVVMQVVGVHADASVWVLRCGGVETLRTDLGTVQALTYARVPDGPYDTAAQIWLDPQRHYLPVRATWRSGPNDEGMDMRLREVVK